MGELQLLKWALSVGDRTSSKSFPEPAVEGGAYVMGSNKNTGLEAYLADRFAVLSYFFCSCKFPCIQINYYTIF